MKTDVRLQRLTERFLEDIDGDGDVNYVGYLKPVGLQARGTYDQITYDVYFMTYIITYIYDERMIRYYM